MKSLTDCQCFKWKGFWGIPSDPVFTYSINYANDEYLIMNTNFKNIFTIYD